jgi:drug/metabolite transporter (DMT)-like permease
VVKIARSKNLSLQIFRSIFLVGEAFLFTLSFKLLPIADVHSIVAVAPIFVTALSALWLKEKVGLRRWLAVLIGFAGVMTILRPGFEGFNELFLLPLLAAIAFAFYQILLRISSRYDDGQVSQFYTGIVPLVVVTFLVPFFWVQPDFYGWIALIAGGIFISLGHLFLIFAFQYATPSAVQPFNYTLLVWATLFGWLFYKELPDEWTIAGALIVVASGLYTLYRERKHATRQS